MEKKPEAERLSVAYQIRLSPAQRAMLDRAAASSGISVADILRVGGMALAGRRLRESKGEG